VENGERFTAELWVEFGGPTRSDERTRAHRSELAMVSSLRAVYRRERARKARVDASTLLGASPWTSCALGADERGHRRRTGDIWQTDGALAIHDGELGFDSEKTATD